MSVRILYFRGTLVWSDFRSGSRSSAVAFSALSRGLLTLFILAGLTGCSKYWEKPEEHRLRNLFNIPFYLDLNEENIRAGVLKNIPLGTAEAKIYLRLDQLGMGVAGKAVRKDKYSYYYRAGVQEKEIVVRIDLDPNDGETIHTHYGIILELDEMRVLNNVVAHVWLTGP